MKKNQLILGLVVLVAIVALLAWGRQRFHFDFGVFRTQLAQADLIKICIGFACILVAYGFRALRWEFLLRHNMKVRPLSLLGTQVIGFTAIALIGRVADPVRPYLVAKKTGLPITNQIAVYIVERLFDAGTMALIFSSAILLSSWFGTSGAMPHAELVKRSGYWGLGLTVLGALFLVAVRLAGTWVASFLEGSFGLISKKIGHAVGEKIRAFHTGLDTMRSFGDFALAASLSVGMWLLIALAYIETMRAFVASPQLAATTPANCVLMMVVSGGASAFQLPVIGWFTQIGAVAAALSGFFGAAPEAATACAATLLLVSFLGVIPIGLVWAQFENISLRKVTVESEHEVEALADDTSVEPASPTS